MSTFEHFTVEQPVQKISEMIENDYFILKHIDYIVVMYIKGENYV